MTDTTTVRDRLPEILRLHGMWLRNEVGGVRANLYGAILTGADLYGANLTDANLRGANLYGADLYGANLTDANLRGANLYGADLYGANLTGAILTDTDLYGADLYGADLYGAILTDANLRGANLRGASLGWCVVGAGAVAQWSARYRCLTVRDKDGVRWLRFGCEARTLDQWDEHVAELCKKHEPNHAARYEAEIRALVALCRTLDMEEIER